MLEDQGNDWEPSHRTLGRSLGFVLQADSHGSIVSRGHWTVIFVPMPLNEDPYTELMSASIAKKSDRVCVPLKPELSKQSYTVSI